MKKLNLTLQRMHFALITLSFQVWTTTQPNSSSMQKVSVRTVNKMFQIGTKFSDLINTNVKIVVDPLRVVYENYEQVKTATPHVLTTYRNHLKYLENEKKKLPNFEVKCAMSIHRKHCKSSKIQNMERIAWDTLICFQWMCVKTLKMAGNTTLRLTSVKQDEDKMPLKNIQRLAVRIEDCWTGSLRSPIFIIGKDGCTNEKTMISSPVYEPSLSKASASGWLSVRLAGIDHVRLACTVRVCDPCDERCSLRSPPDCRDYLPNSPQSIWQNTLAFKEICKTPEELKVSSKSSSCVFSKTKMFFNTILPYLITISLYSKLLSTIFLISKY